MEKSHRHRLTRSADPPNEDWPAGFDSLVAQTPGIDRFCSSSRWVRPARTAFAAESDLKHLVFEGGEALFIRSDAHHDTRLLLPLDFGWLLACPLAMPSPRLAMPGFFAAIHRELPSWDVTIVSGLPLRGALSEAVQREVIRHDMPARPLGEVVRCVADLSSGDEAWLSRRSTKFRASVRRAERLFDRSGLRLLDVSDEATDTVFRRFEALEERSWKGREGTGLSNPEMARFCRDVFHETFHRGESLAFVARDSAGRDVGFIFGAVVGQRYRGIQMSFDQSYKQIGIGNAMQLKLIRNLAARGVTTYDLGAHLPYKSRWADYEEVTWSIALLRQG